jgi:hypothetical protein
MSIPSDTPSLNASTAANEPAASYSTLVPPEIGAILGKPPVLAVESLVAYERLFVAIARERCPRASLEWLLVRDIADMDWQIQRLRRAITSVLDITYKEALEKVLREFCPKRSVEEYYEIKTLVEKWYEGPAQRDQVKSVLSKYNLSSETIIGQAFVLRCVELEKMERMLTAAEVKRNAFIRAFDDAARFRLWKKMEQSPTPMFRCSQHPDECAFDVLQETNCGE